LKPNARLDIILTFKSYASDGILLYSQQAGHGKGDFVSIALVNG
jgi:hypothetical protein